MTILSSLRLIGMVHLPALPGSVGNDRKLDAIVEYAVDEAQKLKRAGFDAVVVENFGDFPFCNGAVGPHTVAGMAVVAREIVRSVGLPLGVNVLRNDARSALGVAALSGAAFIRVNVHTGVCATDQGLIEGRAAETLAYRRLLGADVAILADVHVKHAVNLNQPDIALAAEETAYRGLADGLIVSGATTGRAADLERVAAVKKAVRDRPVWVGSGVDVQTVRRTLDVADGAIVGTSIKQDGVTTNPVDLARAEALVRAAR